MLFVACAIIIHENKILVTQRGPLMKHPLKWEFPGGKIEPHELPESCIVREIQEELQVTISIIACLNNVVFESTDLKITLTPFVATLEKGEIQLSEHHAFVWLCADELDALDWIKPDRGVVAELKRYLSDNSK